MLKLSPKPIQASGDAALPPDHGRALPDKKKKAGASSQPEASLIPSPITGVVPPVEHRWKPGQSGNPAGRPNLIKSAYERALMEEIEINVGTGKKKKKVKMPVVDAIAKNLCANAMISFKFGVGAAQELRKVVEPETEQPEGGITDRQFIRDLATIAQAAKHSEKKANAVEV